MYLVLKDTTKGEPQEGAFSSHSVILNQLIFLVTDPSMVSAYMYPAGAPGAQAAPQAQAGPTTSPAYSSYQPTPTPGYQVCGQGNQPPLTCCQPLPVPSLHPLPSIDCGISGPTEPPSHLPASTDQHHRLHGEPANVHGLPAIQHAGKETESLLGLAQDRSFHLGLSSSQKDLRLSCHSLLSVGLHLTLHRIS